MTEITTWLVQQAPAVVIMGIVIYWLAKRLEKTQDDKDTLSRDVVKLTTIWEEKYQNETNKEEKIIELLTEIKTLVQK